MKRIIILFIFSFLINQMAIADIKMVIKTDDGVFKAWSNDTYMRGKFNQSANSMSEPMPNGDFFSDFRSGKMYMIFDKEKLMMDMAPPAFATDQPKPPKLNITYSNKRSGKTIAGLTTTKYDLIVQGKKCFEVLLTKNKAYSAIMKKYSSLNSEQGDEQDMCKLASEQTNDELDAKYGYPVKMTKANGQLDMLLMEFKPNKTAPKKYLAFPKGYKVTTMMEAMPTLMKMQANQ